MHKFLRVRIFDDPIQEKKTRDKKERLVCVCVCVCVCVFQTNASKRVHPAGKVLDTVNQIISPISAIQLALDHLRVMIRLPGQNPVKWLDGGGGAPKKKQQKPSLQKNRTVGFGDTAGDFKPNPIAGKWVNRPPQNSGVAPLRRSRRVFRPRARRFPWRQIEAVLVGHRLSGVRVLWTERR